MGNEKLAPVGSRTRIRHGKAARTVVAKAGVKLVLEAITRAAGARALGATALNHEVGDDAVEAQAIVKPALC